MSTDKKEENIEDRIDQAIDVMHRHMSKTTTLGHFVPLIIYLDEALFHDLANSKGFLKLIAIGQDITYNGLYPIIKVNIKDYLRVHSNHNPELLFKPLGE